MTEEHKVKYTHAVPIARMEFIDEDKFRSSYVVALDRFKDKEEIVAAEIGVYEGINSKYMLITCPKLKLHLVDAWDNIVVYTGGPVQSKVFMDTIKQIAYANLTNCGLEPRFTFTNKNSKDAVLDFPDDFFDYIYIDGDHEYEAVKLDMKLWWPKLKTGGVFGGHDVGMEEVSKAVGEFAKEHNISNDNYFRDNGKDIKRSDWWILK